MKRYSRKKLITAIALLGLRERCDRAAAKLDRAGDKKGAFALDRLAAKIQRALNEMPESTDAVVGGNLLDTLHELLDLNEKEEEILTDALEGVYEESDFESTEEESEEEEEVEEEEAEDLEDEDFESEFSKSAAGFSLDNLRKRIRLAKIRKMLKKSMEDGGRRNLRVGTSLRPHPRLEHKEDFDKDITRLRRARAKLRNLRKFDG